MFTQPFHDFDTYNTFLSEGGALAVVVEGFPATPRRDDAGPRGVPPVGVRRGGAPRQPQCLTLGRLAPLYYALRTGPAVPASQPEARPDPLPPLPENATAWRVPIPDGEIPSQPPPPLQGCGSNSNRIESGSPESRS